MPPLLEFDRVSYRHPDGSPALHDISWRVAAGEAWAVSGPMGAGKTTLARLAAGDILPTSGGVFRPAARVRFVSFKEDSRRFRYAGHYYQQRFEFADDDEPLSLADFLRRDEPAAESRLTDVAAEFALTPLLDRSFMKLSNGEVRRARVARACLADPELLVLDGVFLGLDAANRAEVAACLGRRFAAGVGVVLVAEPADRPTWVTHELRLAAGRVETAGPVLVAEPVIEFDRVTVAHGGRKLLDNVTWTVRAGQRWVVAGPNGAGKTTLLSLVCGDHPQAYANRVRLFGRHRGTGESVWELKQRIGLVSPELHFYFTHPMTAVEAVGTGFFDTTTPRPMTDAQAATARDTLRSLGGVDLAGRPFPRLSTGEQRLVLFARAVVKRPELLILDEPFQAFDATTVARLLDWLRANLTPRQTLLLVTHRAAEVPPWATHRLDLTAGEFACTAAAATA